MEGTNIAWADHTFNPWMGCTKVSPGCRNCYAEKVVSGRMGLRLWGKFAERRVTSDANWRKVAKWNVDAERSGIPARVFCGSLCDVFEDHLSLVIPRNRLWELVAVTPYLDWLLLTKRPENIPQMLPFDWIDGYQNAWLGVSIESNDYAGRAQELVKVQAAGHFISYEPALGPLDRVDLTRIEWVIYGGESGPGHREHDIQWARDMRSRCAAEGVAFFYKQSPGARPGMDAEIDGCTVRQYPDDLICRRRVV